MIQSCVWNKWSSSKVWPFLPRHTTLGTSFPCEPEAENKIGALLKGGWLFRSHRIPKSWHSSVGPPFPVMFHHVPLVRRFPVYGGEKLGTYQT
jgi:hypothetical protein